MKAVHNANFTSNVEKKYYATTRCFANLRIIFSFKLVFSSVITLSVVLEAKKVFPVHENIGFTILR